MKNLSFLFLVLSINLIGFSQNTTNFDSTIVLQPSAEGGIDAEIFSCSSFGYDTTNYGDIEDFCATDWTRNGQETIIRSLIYFDLSAIPNASLIQSAKLSLYYNPNSPEGQHSSLSGSNTSVIRRITTPWNEHTVTWNNQPQSTSQNQIYNSASTSAVQNFVDIDITQLIIDSKNNPSTSFGFLLKLVTEQYYRKLVFASSDHPTDSLHPKLVIHYKPSTNGFNYQGAKTTINCFPNPVKDIIHLSCKESLGKVDMSITDLSGRFVFSQAVCFNKYLTIDISHFKSGVYFLFISNKKGYIERKMIIIE